MVTAIVSVALVISMPSRRRLLQHLPIEVTPCLNCPGEFGEAVELEETEKRNLNITGVMSSDHFNIFVSEKISLWRSLPDVRHPKCKSIKYKVDDLPSASVILVFKNERFSILMRTIYSVILRSPRASLKEIILIDDQSELEELKTSLDEYCETHFGNLVQIYRAPRRLGLIQGKNFGAKKATGDIVVFLDAHCEANIGWLEPILFRLKQNRNAVVCPIIDTIDAETFEYRGGQVPRSIGGFSWSMFFTWIPIPQRLMSIADKITEPVPSPTMAGGLLAADRKAFFEFGGYDDEMEVWGAENLEISFRTWMCGGSIEFIPCSHVGHVFRHGHPYNMTGEKGGSNVNERNSVRLIEVWLDEYKKFYYQRNKNSKIKYENEDLSERMELRKKLKCKDFRWYLKTVYPEKLIPDENTLSHGSIKNRDTGLCLDTLGNVKPGLTVSVFPWQSGGSNNQYFSFYLNNKICIQDYCLTVRDASGFANDGDQITFAYPDRSPGWSYTRDNTIMFLGKSMDRLCMSVKDLKANDPIILRKCNKTDGYQKFILENYIVNN
ncbi:hypothetical protein ACOME3_006066 [Neoechinorhynchus agilis]